MKYTPPTFDLILAEKSVCCTHWLYGNGFNVAHVSSVAYEPHVPYFSPCFMTFSPSLQLSIVNKHLHSDGMWRPKEKNEIIMSLNSGLFCSFLENLYSHYIKFLSTSFSDSFAVSEKGQRKLCSQHHAFTFTSAVCLWFFYVLDSGLARLLCSCFLIYNDKKC